MRENRQFQIEMEKIQDDFMAECREQLQYCSLDDEAYSASMALAFVIQDTLKKFSDTIEKYL